jgi:hypothetical protein
MKSACTVPFPLPLPPLPPEVPVTPPQAASSAALAAPSPPRRICRRAGPVGMSGEPVPRNESVMVFLLE